MTSLPRPLPLALLCLASAACSDPVEEAAPVLARPVTVLTLNEAAPPPDALLPGLVTPYRESTISFEVSGRIEYLANAGDDLEGIQVDRAGEVAEEGPVIASLDPAPFERALRQSERRIASARAQLVAEQVQLEDVLAETLRGAVSNAQAADLAVTSAKDDVEANESAVDLAQTTLKRNEELLPSGAVSDIAVRESATTLSQERARLAQSRTLVSTRLKELEAANFLVAETRGSIALQQAKVEAQQATIEELEQQVLDAQSNLDDCVLHAPFAGRITAVHVAEGSVVSASTPVVTLTMMTPIEVELTVSAAVDDELVLGTDAIVYPMNGSEPDTERAVRATLFEKRGVANEGTRTFPVGLSAPNQRRDAREEFAGEPTTPYLLPVFRNPLDLPDENGLYTVKDAVGGTLDDAYVLRVQGVSQGEREASSLAGRLTSERIPIRIGERTLRVASFELVEIVGETTVDEGDLLVSFTTPAHESSFIVLDNRWLLRPGDLVQVGIGRQDRTPGFYVPVTAIREINGKTSVFAVDDGSIARRIDVQALDSAGRLRRIEGEGLAEGAQIVLDGTHFLMDGDRVTVTSQEARP